MIHWWKNQVIDLIEEKSPEKHHAENSSQENISQKSAQIVSQAKKLAKKLGCPYNFSDCSCFLPPFFLSQKLFDFFSFIFLEISEEEIQIVPNLEVVISALNFLRFLILRKKTCENLNVLVSSNLDMVQKIIDFWMKNVAKMEKKFSDKKGCEEILDNLLEFGVDGTPPEILENSKKKVVNDIKMVEMLVMMLKDNL